MQLFVMVYLHHSATSPTEVWVCTCSWNWDWAPQIERWWSDWNRSHRASPWPIPHHPVEGNRDQTLLYSETQIFCVYVRAYVCVPVWNPIWSFSVWMCGQIAPVPPDHWAPRDEWTLCSCCSLQSYLSATNQTHTYKTRTWMSDWNMIAQNVHTLLFKCFFVCF